MAAIINIPQRLQTVNATSAIGAGIRLLPLLLLSPVASTAAGFFVSKLRVPPLYLLVIGASLQKIGVGLFSSIDSTDLSIPKGQYGYQVVMGFVFGLNLSTILMMAPLVVQQKDMGKWHRFCVDHLVTLILLAVAIGSVTDSCSWWYNRSCNLLSSAEQSHQSQDITVPFWGASCRLTGVVPRC
jgi:hypothetical protein